MKSSGEDQKHWILLLRYSPISSLFITALPLAFTMKSPTITYPSRFASSFSRLVFGLGEFGSLVILQDNPRFDGYNIKEAVNDFVNASLVYVSLE